jgi:serine/threonine protein phosphatase 1
MDYAIGDIHGCLEKLVRLLEVIRYDPAADRLIFLGDYIDRGPASQGVLDLLLRLQRDNPAHVFLMGNHEDNLLAYLSAWMQDAETSAWFSDPFFAGGGAATLRSYDPQLRHPEDPHALSVIPPAHIQFLRALPLYWTDERYIAVHAGVRPSIPLAQQKPNDLLRIRAPFLHTPHHLGRYVVFGHTPFRQVKREADKIGIDTGACYTHLGYGTLTAFCLQTQQTFHAQ